MTGAALLAGDYKNHEGVSLKVAGDGPLGAVHADCFDTNKLRGYVDNPQVDLPLKANGKLDVAAGVGQHGQLTVTRFTPEKRRIRARPIWYPVKSLKTSLIICSRRNRCRRQSAWASWSVRIILLPQPAVSSSRPAGREG